MGKLYLVTGAGGHLGGTVVRRLLERGAAVRALALPGEEAYIPPGAEIVTGDVRSPASLAPFFDRGGYDELSLIHIAAIVTIASKAEAALWDVNVGGTENVLRLAEAAGVERVVYVSTVHAIPERPAPEMICETDRFSPALVVGPYARSKAAAARLALSAAERGLDVRVVHPSGILGPGDARGRNHSVRTLRAVAAGRLPVSVQGGYDFVDVRDAAEGILSCEERGRRGECYILNGEYTTLTALFALCCELAGRRAPRWEIPAGLAAAAPGLEWASVRLGHRQPVITPLSVYTLQTNARFSRAKAERELDYRPRPLRETVRDTLAIP